MGGGQAGQAKWAVVNEVWERGEIVMCIAVPDMSILAENNQLIKYSSLVTTTKNGWPLSVGVAY